MDSSLYGRLRTRHNLEEAWRAIRDNGRTSNSPQTKDEVRAFADNAFGNLLRIQRKLRLERYEFTPAKGISIKRDGKKPRPLVLACVQDRIVQRAIMQILCDYAPVHALFAVPTSFGTSREQSIGQAMAMVQQHLRSDTKYVIRSDIKDFFTRIPRSKVLAELEPLLDDALFSEILDQATHVDLDNLAALGADADRFPDDTTGVAQGSSLSPLLGNIFLQEFDKLTNSHGVTCLRYVDDFLILAPSERQARDCFKVALGWLNQHGLEAHELGSDKCYCGPSQKTFDFLGCSVQPGLICPNGKSRQRLRASVKEILERPFESRTGKGRVNAKGTVARILYDVGNTTAAWAAAYGFCNDLNAISNLEKQIDGDVLSYLKDALGRLKQEPPREKCERLGVRSISAIVRKAPSLPH